MQKIFKAVLRDIWHHKYRSLITFLAIFAVIAFPLAMYATSPNISYSITYNNDYYKLSHLDLRFTSGNDSLIPLINDSIYDTLGQYPGNIESRLLARGKTIIGQEEPTYEATTLVGIPKSMNQSTNRFFIESGNITLEDNNIYVIDSFAEAWNLHIGSNLTTLIGNSEINFTITGLVRSVEFLSYNLNQGCVVYLDTELLHSLVGLPNQIVNGITIFFWEDVTSEEITQCAEKIREDVFEVEGIPLSFSWQMREISVSAVLDGALEIASGYLSAAALIIIIVVGIVIFIITKRYALEQRKQTGTLYAFGFTPSKILQAFLLRTLIICTLAMVLGTLGGYGILRIIINILVNQWGIISFTPRFSPFLLTIILSSSLIMSTFFTWLAARSNVSLTPYEAIRGKVKGYSGTKLNFMSGWKNAIKYPIRNLFRNKGRSILTFLAFAGSIMLAFSLIITKSSVYITKDIYFSEQVNWDVKTVFVPGFNNITGITDNITGITDFEPYLETIVQSEDHLDNVIYLRGVDPNTNLSSIDLQKGSSFSNSTASEIIMSIYVAERLNLDVGDNLSFTFLGQEINTTIVGLSRDLELVYSISIQLSSLEDILGYSPHNGMLSKVDSSQMNSVIEELNNLQEVAFALSREKFENRIYNLIQTQTIIVNVMVFLGFLVSFLSIFATTFISSLEREREYALLRVFGYTSVNILGQLLFEIFILCIFALILGLSTGNLLALYWNSIISSIFFTIDLYGTWNNYLFSGGFAIVTIFISIIPAFQLIIRQVLAEQIREE